MKTYYYDVPQFNEFGDLTDSSSCAITEKEILANYWNYWSFKMKKKYGANSPLITETNCIRDWVTINYAYEQPESSFSVSFAELENMYKYAIKNEAERYKISISHNSGIGPTVIINSENVTDYSKW